MCLNLCVSIRWGIRVRISEPPFYYWVCQEGFPSASFIFIRLVLIDVSSGMWFLFFHMQSNAISKEMTLA